MELITGRAAVFQAADPTPSFKSAGPRVTGIIQRVTEQFMSDSLKKGTISFGMLVAEIRFKRPVFCGN